MCESLLIGLSMAFQKRRQEWERQRCPGLSKFLTTLATWVKEEGRRASLRAVPGWMTFYCLGTPPSRRRKGEGAEKKLICHFKKHIFSFSAVLLCSWLFIYKSSTFLHKFISIDILFELLLSCLHNNTVTISQSVTCLILWKSLIINICPMGPFWCWRDKNPLSNCLV